METKSPEDSPFRTSDNEYPVTLYAWNILTHFLPLLLQLPPHKKFKPPTGYFSEKHDYGKTAIFNFSSEKLRFMGISRTGGIGSGQFFMLNGNHTLGLKRVAEVISLINAFTATTYFPVRPPLALSPSFSVIPSAALVGQTTGRLHMKK